MTAWDAAVETFRIEENLECLAVMVTGIGSMNLPVTCLRKSGGTYPIRNGLSGLSSFSCGGGSISQLVLYRSSTPRI